MGAVESQNFMPARDPRTLTYFGLVRHLNDTGVDVRGLRADKVLRIGRRHSGMLCDEHHEYL